MAKFNPEVPSIYAQISQIKKKYDEENSRPPEVGILGTRIKLEQSLVAQRGVQIKAMSSSKDESATAKRAYISSRMHFSSTPMENLKPRAFHFLLLSRL